MDVHKCIYKIYVYIYTHIIYTLYIYICLHIVYMYVVYVHILYVLYIIVIYCNILYLELHNCSVPLVTTCYNTPSVGGKVIYETCQGSATSVGKR